MWLYKKSVLNDFFIATGTSETLEKTKKIDKQKSYVQSAGFCQLTKFVHPVSVEPEVTHRM